MQSYFWEQFLKSNHTIENNDVTILNNKIINANKTDAYQLYRCPKQKIYEAELLLKLPYNYSFLDIGAHFGDTCLTMALYAKNNNRSDIRFFAFEPNHEKCNYIRKICELNHLNICIKQQGVGNENCKIIPHHYKNTTKGTITYNQSDDGQIDMIKLDSIKSQLEPIGFMHIDVEGWESNVLKGSDNIINNQDNKIIIIAECWDSKESIRLGFKEDPEKEILTIMDNFSNYKQQSDLIDSERNLVFFSEYYLHP